LYPGNLTNPKEKLRVSNEDATVTVLGEKVSLDNKMKLVLAING